MALEQHGCENVQAVFADTGNEHEEVYSYVRYLHQRLGVPTNWIRRDLTPEWWHRRDYVRDKWPEKGVPDDVVSRALALLEKGPTGNPYLDLCIIKGRFPSRMAQFCTQWLKTEPLTELALELIESHGSVWSWQGIRLDESHSRKSRLQGSGACVRGFEVIGGGSTCIDQSFAGRPPTYLTRTAHGAFSLIRCTALAPTALAACPA